MRSPLYSGRKTSLWLSYHLTLTVIAFACCFILTVLTYKFFYYYPLDVCKTFVNMEDIVPKPGLPSTAIVVILVTQEPPAMTVSIYSVPTLYGHKSRNTV